MAGPLIVRLLLDAQDEFMRAADAVPLDARNHSTGGLNAPGWVIAHAGFFHDVWINVDGQGKTTEDCEPWLRAWIRRQDTQRGVPIEADFSEARSAVDRVVERATPFLQSLTDADIDGVPRFRGRRVRAGHDTRVARRTRYRAPLRARIRAHGDRDGRRRNRHRPPGRDEAHEGRPMTILALQLVFDAADPDEIMRFWGRAIDYDNELVRMAPDELREWRKGFPQYDGRGRIDDAKARHMPVYIQQVPEPKRGRNRLRPELVVRDFAEIGRSMPGRSRR